MTRTTADTAATTPLPPRRRSSLALRLTLWYAVSSFMIVGIAAGLLYWVLVTNLLREDDEFLSGKVDTIRSLVRQSTATDRAELRWEIDTTERAPQQDVRLYIRLLDEHGAVTMETRGMSEMLPAAAFPAPYPVGVEPSKSQNVFLNHQRHRLVSARAEAGPQKAAWTVQVGLVEEEEDLFLAQFRQSMWAILALAVLACAGVGLAIARRGLRPLQDVAATARRIRATTLGDRVETAQLPRELADLAETFNAMLARLEEAFGRLSQFSADIAHELRTPINILRGETEVALSRARTAPELREVLASSLEECTSLSRLIDNLLFLARSEHPETAIERAPTDVAAELKTICEFYAAVADDAGVGIEVIAPPELPASLDRALFQRAVGNLVENALAHTPRNGTIQIIGAAGAAPGEVQITVADTGAGIPREHLAHVFTRFHRVDAARSRNSGGVGLGLAIVRSIALLHGGTASVESEPGAGTRITLRFLAPQSARHA